MDHLKYKENNFSITKRQIEYICQFLCFYKPKSILEFGAGVSSQIFIDYSNENNANFINIENDDKWMTSHSIKHKLIEYSPYTIDDIEFNNVNYYENLTENIKDNKYDFVLIDGPIGWEQIYEYTRVQLLEIIPYLADNCVVMVHDTQRHSAKNVLKIFENKIDKDYIYFKLDDNLDCRNMTIYNMKRRSN